MFVFKSCQGHRFRSQARRARSRDGRQLAEDFEEKHSLWRRLQAMIPHLINENGICGTCEAVANDMQWVQCFFCKEKFHGECGANATFCTKTFLKQFKGLKSSNFWFICDTCITKHENIEASSIKQQLAEVVSSVANLAKEVKSLKEEKQHQKSEVSNVVKPVQPPPKTKEKAWSNPETTKKKVIKPKFTVCIQNSNGTNVDVNKISEVVTSNGIQIKRASVDQKTKNIYVELPSEECREKLLPLLNETNGLENQAFNVKEKSPVITINQVLDYVDDNDLTNRIKNQNPEIKELIDKGSEFKILFEKKLKENNSRNKGIEHMNGKTLSYVVVRVSDEIRKLIKINGNRIFIGLTAHRINDRFYVKACAKCHRYGHYHAECSKKACCGYCTSEEHESKECPVYVNQKIEEFECVNCQDKGKPYKGHSSHWNKCPVFLERQTKVKNSIPYYSKN